MTMRRIIYILLLSILGFASYDLSAQERIIETSRNHQVSVGGMFATSNQLISIYVLAFEDIFSNYDIEGLEVVPFNIQYRYKPNRRLWIGFDFAYEVLRYNYQKENERRGSGEAQFLTGAFKLDFHYIDRPMFKMYSGIGFAYTSLDLDRDRIDDTGYREQHDMEELFPNFQLTLAGFRIGSQFAFFTEIGVGYAGVVNAGFSLRL